MNAVIAGTVLPSLFGPLTKRADLYVNIVLRAVPLA